MKQKWILKVPKKLNNETKFIKTEKIIKLINNKNNT